MNPVTATFEYLASAFNGLGLWRREQSVWGNRLASRTFDRSLYLWMHRCGFMGRSEREILSRLVKPGMTVVDVGANVGLYTLYMADLVGRAGRVIAFEPDPDLASLLVDNCEANGIQNVQAHRAALGTKPERMILHRMSINSGDNHLGSHARTAFLRPVEVEVVSFDSLLPGVRPDFIKVDVQGWELNVLRGMERTLRGSDALIYLEFWPDGLKRAGDAPAELFSFVRGLGLDFYSADGWTLFDEPTFLAMAGKVKGLNFINLLASRGSPPRSQRGK
jgi:FkbM family methyltransferase